MLVVWAEMESEAQFPTSPYPSPEVGLGQSIRSLCLLLTPSRLSSTR